MEKWTRREFLEKGRDASFTITAALATSRQMKAVPPSDRIRVAIAGIRGRGMGLALGFATRPDCEVAYLADPDASLFEEAPNPGYIRGFDKSLHGPRVQGVTRAQGRKPETVPDLRQALDDPEVDAVVIATPDHWHALATIWACQAGKDVFVEKPASHNAWEGRQMVAAARKYGRVVQHGTQSRSSPELQAAREYIKSGKLGRVHFCRVLDQKRWGNQPIVEDSEPPSHLDWDMWNGPAPESPYNFNLWEWWNHFWRYSGGDIINDSIHQLDLARWMMGKDYPQSVYSTGGRYAEQGAFETPDTQVAVYQFDDVLLSFEMTLYTPQMIMTPNEIREGNEYPLWLQDGCRIEIFGSEGFMVVGRHGGGWQVFDAPEINQPVAIAGQTSRRPSADHIEDFCRCIRTRGKPNADIEEGHRSTLLSHYGNISYRLGGRKLTIDPGTEKVVGDEEANRLLKREYRSPWLVPETV